MFSTLNHSYSHNLIREFEARLAFSLRLYLNKTDMRVMKVKIQQYSVLKYIL